MSLNYLTVTGKVAAISFSVRTTCNQKTRYVPRQQGHTPEANKGMAYSPVLSSGIWYCWDTRHQEQYGTCRRLQPPDDCRRRCYQAASGVKERTLQVVAINTVESSLAVGSIERYGVVGAKETGGHGVVAAINKDLNRAVINEDL